MVTRTRNKVTFTNTTLPLGFGLFTGSKQPLRLAYNRTEESYRVCVSNSAWSRNLNNQAAYVGLGLFCHRKKKT